LFWYVGLIPDMATMRDKTTIKPLKYLFGMMAVGWRGSGRHWHRYNSLYLLLAAIATPLVVSVHTVISFDFAISIVPGWHTTVLPPYFVAGAIFSGFAMVITLMIPMRKMFKLEDFITMRHFDLMAKVLLATGLIVVYGYIVEAFTGWYSGSQYEITMLKNRFFGPYAGVVWLLVFCNAITIQLLWFKKVRTNLAILFIISLVVNTGMFLERFMIVVISLTKDYMPSAWGNFIPTQWDWGIMIGSIGFFLVMMFIFVRTLPMISMFEVRELLHDTKHKEHVADAGAEAGAEA
jgi:molybdopterin-containing oxidoreductase family membrane subunit